MKPLNCVIIEDNHIDRITLEGYISRFPFLILEGSFENPIESLELIRNKKIDIFFLDIDMPGISGIEFKPTLPDTALCIFITAHPEYALEAFNVQALDYILKPVTFPRLEKAIERAIETLELKNKALLYSHQFENDLIIIKEGTAIYRLSFGEIIYLEALTNYTKIVTAGRNYITLSNLKNLLEKLPRNRFIRIHRSYAVALDKIHKIDQHELSIGKWNIPIGKTYRLELKQAIDPDQPHADL